MSKANIDINTKSDDKNQVSSLGEQEKMYKAGVHFVYRRSTSHPKMRSYFYNARVDTGVFDLDKTKLHLDEAKDFLKSLGLAGEKILMLATKPENSDIIKEIGQKLEIPFVSKRWLGGTLTNYKVIRKRVNYYEELKKKKKEGGIGGTSKKETARLEKKLTKLDYFLRGLVFLEKLPAVLIVVDPKNEKSAVAEAKKLGIPVMALMNSDCNPKEIEYIIPGNDTSRASVQYIFDSLVNAYQDGVKSKGKEKKEDKKGEKVKPKKETKLT